MKSLIMILNNVATGTFHPIYYLEKMLPGGVQPGQATRFKSKGHHTTGFPTREEAIMNINNELVPHIEKELPLYKDITIDITTVIEWNGEGVPADTTVYNTETKQAIL